MPRLLAATFTVFLLASTAVFPQSTSTAPNPDDVPQQHPPGTNNPDIAKQRRPAPAAPKTQDANQNSADVPQQQPGTDNPDVAKQRQPQDRSATGSTSTRTRGKKKKARSTTDSQ